MQIFFNSINKSSASHHLLTYDNQLEKFCHRLLANDNRPENFNKICEKSGKSNHSNNDSDESNNDNELNYDLNDEDETIVDKEDSMNDEDEIIDNKEDFESKVEEDNTIADENVLQDQMTDHYLGNYNYKGTPFLSSYIKYTSKIWKRRNYLNVENHVGIVGEYSEGFINFTKWKYDNICEVLHLTYSKSGSNRRKFIITC